MEQKQIRLASALPRLVDAITRVAPSLHVGVVTSDMGVGGLVVGFCETRYGDDGRLIDTAGASGCSGTYPSVFEFGIGSADRVEDLGCVARVGTGGCGWEQQLEAALKALSPSVPQSWTAPDYTPITFVDGTTGHADGANAGLIRDDSVLAVLLLTDEEDCSASNPDLFNPDSVEFGSVDLNLRCIAYSEAVHPVSRYVDGFRRLRRDPRRFVYAGIIGIESELDPTVPPDYQAVLDSPAMSYDPNLLMFGKPQPPRRLVEVARDLVPWGAGTALHMISQDDYSDEVAHIASVITSRASGSCE